MLLRQPNLKGGSPSSGGILTRLMVPQVVPPICGRKQNTQRMCHLCKHIENRSKKRKEVDIFVQTSI